jgi:hypothetical protein
VLLARARRSVQVWRHRSAAPPAEHQIGLYHNTANGDAATTAYGDVRRTGRQLESNTGPEPGRHFAAVRRDLRGFIAESEAGRDVEALVEELLS